MTDFTSIQVYAYLNSAWSDLSADVMIDSLRFYDGTRGTSPLDIVGDVGGFEFTLKNNTGKYYPDSASPLSGWDVGVYVKLVFNYAGIPYTHFYGRIPQTGLKYRVGKVATNHFVDVTVLDWLTNANDSPLDAPDIIASVTADTAIENLLNQIDETIIFSADTGDNTFPAVFDGTRSQTTVYTEFSKLCMSESPGRVYITRPRVSGQQLVFENASHRENTHPQKTTATLTTAFLLNSTGGYLLNSTGGYIITSAQPSSPAAVTFNIDDDKEVDAVHTDYGQGIINHVTVTAYPKRVDKELQVLYSLPSSIPLGAGESIAFRANYIDPDGGGTRINAIKASMVDPETPGGADPCMKLLLHLTSDFTDSTGRHIVTNNDAGILDDVYVDPGPEPDVTRISSNILGPFTVFGGYANYNLSIPTSDDFNFGYGAFTIGFYGAYLENTASRAMIARTSNQYAPWVLGYNNGTAIEIYMSSNGSSWDIASAKEWGPLKRNGWTHYEICRDDNGWFYAFADGQLTDTWYSSLGFPNTTGSLSVALWNSTYLFAGMDELYIVKDKALHKKDFTPPARNLSHLLEGDYLLNSSENGTGTDLSSSLTIAVDYYSNYADYTEIKNTSETDGNLIHLQARGRGVYPYDSIETIVKDDTSIINYRSNPVRIDQPYQQTLTPGETWATTIVTDEKDPQTKLLGISFYANKSATNMLRFLQCGNGDLIRVIYDVMGIDGYYYIQNRDVKINSGLAYVTWGLVKGLEPA